MPEIATVERTASQPTPTPGPVMAASVGVRSWDRVELATASRYLTRPIVRLGSDSLFVPDETELLAITFDKIMVNKLRLDRIDLQAADTDLTVINGRVDLPAGVRIGELNSIHASRIEGGNGSGQMTLLCAHLGRRFTLPSIPVELGTAVTQIVSFRTDQADRTRGTARTSASPQRLLYPGHPALARQRDAGVAVERLHLERPPGH